MTSANDRSTAGARRRLALLPALAALALACDGPPPTSPLEPETPGERPVPEGAVLLTCTASVRAETMACTTPPPAATPGNAAIIGGQDVHVLLSNDSTVYDDGIFGTTVTVQNLTRLAMGTSDGVSVEGVRIFFHDQPAVTEGTGTVEVANPHGHDIFTGSVQPYFGYPDLLAPLQISAGRRWEFTVPATVESFEFSVYASAPLIDETAALLGPVWTGAAGTDWLAPENWDDGEVPDSAAATSIPALALLAPGAAQPALTADGAALHLRVGAGSTLGLNGHTLRVLGNVDVPGTVTGGTLVLAGTDAIVAGSLPGVQVEGSATLQKATTTSGPLVVSGSLVTDGKPLVIEVP